MLEVVGLSSGYGRLRVLRDINMTLNKNEVLAVIGPNGAGKTTLLKTIAGAIKPFSGIIKYEGRIINGVPTHLLVRQGIVYVPDSSGVLGRMTVYENLILGAYAARGKSRERLDFVYEVFPVLKEKQRQLASTLSGGEKQMLVLGRALMLNPRLIMLDEPSTGLSPIAVNNLYNLLENLIKSTRLSIILVEQDVGKAFKLAERVYVLEAGTVKAEGTREEMKGRLKRYYVGD